MSVYAPGLGLARFIPPLAAGPRASPIARRLLALLSPGVGDGVVTSRHMVPEGPDRPAIRLHVLSPARPGGPTPAMVWVHGGGHVMGHPQQDNRSNAAFVRDLGITVVSVDYRLGVDAPAPAAAEDVYAALCHVVEHADQLGIDADRVALGGNSAGGGIAAAAALIAHDRGVVTPVCQLLVYPMLDDRTTRRTDMNTRNARIWSAANNKYGWATYLLGTQNVSAYAAPARREDLSGLPPAWIGVGTQDVFHDEDVAYAQRLSNSGVDCTLHVADGAFHAFDILFPKSAVAQRFWKDQASVLKKFLVK